jgi:ketosteroid isomerase-like protein
VATQPNKQLAGRLYNNQYHTLMRIRDGKICEVREYNDTQYSHAVWFKE